MRGIIKTLVTVLLLVHVIDIICLSATKNYLSRTARGTTGTVKMSIFDFNGNKLKEEMLKIEREKLKLKARELEMEMMKFNKIIGIDLLSMKIEECLKTISYMNSNINALRMTPNDDKCHEYIITKTPDINIVLDNFLQNQEWKSADVVYACATVWEQDLLSQLQVQLTELKVDSRVIILDSLLLQSHESFQLMDTYLCNTTWGVATAYIYRKIS
jgi:hypothetical protein